MDLGQDVDLQAAVDRDVLQPIAQANSQSDEPDQYHPLIAHAYRFLIDTLHREPDRILPLDLLARAIRNLNQLAASASPPSTPIQTASTQDPAIDHTPRGKTARADADNVRVKVGNDWIVLSKACKDLRHEVKHGNEDLIRDSLDTFSSKLDQYKSSFVPHFKNVQFVDSHDPSHLQVCKAAVRQAMSTVLRKQPPLTNDEALHYLLSSIPRPNAFQYQPFDPFEEPLRERLAQGIRRRYRGDAHRRLLAFAKEVNFSLFTNNADGRKPYYKGTTIVQSSGTGKTRMVLQLGRIAPLLFLCIRPPAASARMGYPLGDMHIVDITLTEWATLSFTDTEKAAILLAAWFDTLASTLQQQASRLAKFEALVQLNNFGTSGHQDLRDAFFATVATEARSLAQLGPVGGEHNKIFSHYLDAPVRRLSQQIRLVQEHLSQGVEAAHDMPLFVAIDECVTFPPGLLNSICRAWAYIGELEDKQRKSHQEQHGKSGQEEELVCFWLLLLSTNSSATTFVRPQLEYSSLRHQNAIPLPTFVGVGFDVLRVELEPLQIALNVADPAHIQKYGRPLWISLVEGSFWPTAMTKLMGTGKFVPARPTISFNVLASRLALRYAPTRSADSPLFGEQATFARSAVDRHMRILDRVDSDAILHISSPSEPVLAIAASLAMMPTPLQRVTDTPLSPQKGVNRYGSILETVKSMCLASADVDILKGIRGELMARLLLMSAWDAAKVKEPGFQTSEDLAWKARVLLQPVALESILDGLVQLDQATFKTVHSQIERVCSRVRDGSPADADVQAWTHFTHFDILEVKVQHISPSYLWYCWKRGVAIQMAHPQHGIDGIIPVFVGDIHQPFDKGVEGETATGHSGCHVAEAQAARQMTYIAWEAKNRQSTSPGKADEAAQKAVHAGPKLRYEQGDEAGLTDRGILTLLADMGAKDQPARVKKIDETESMQLWLRGLGGPTNYPCLDTLEIRNVVDDFLRTVANRVEYELYNRVPDPMDLSADTNSGDDDPAALSVTIQPHEGHGQGSPPDEPMQF